MGMSGTVTIGDSPIFELIEWAFLIALAPGLVGLAWAILRRCLRSLKPGGPSLFDLHEDLRGFGRRGCICDDHKARDRPAHRAYGPWDR